MAVKYLIIALGGGLGSLLRFGCSMCFPTKNFPLPTLLVNIIGSFCIGIIMALFAKNHLQENWKLFLATGICGGFTTFSAFAWENVQLLQQGKSSLAFFYIALSLIVGIAATWLGYKLINH